MPVSDALVVGEQWISEHYFTTDATKQSFQAKVIQRRKEWDEQKAVGTVRTRFTAARGDLLSTLTTLEAHDPRLGEFYEQIEHVLGFDRIGLTRERHGPVTRINSIGLSNAAPLAIVHATVVESVEDLLNKEASTLVEPYVVDDTTTYLSVARAVSSLFTSLDHPQFVLVLAGGLALIAERERWYEGRYLLVDLQLVCERNADKKGGEVDRALTILEATSLAPDAEGDIWWLTALAESVKHTVGVSEDLREGVRLSIEILANEVVERRRQLGLDPLPAGQAQPLARQALRFLYRILFLLYAEASPELGVLPVGAPEYERGYSLDRLRDLTLVELTNPRSAGGTHLYESLYVLFGLVDRGHEPIATTENGTEGLTFRSLKADLFLPSATALIDETKLGNQAVQRVLRHLLLSKEKRGADRGFISYAELGINQLGAVYEGLMSYTGFFAETDLYEVAKGGDASKGSWVVPVDRSQGISPDDFVKVEDELSGERKPVLHLSGSFVFRLAGRERQQSASYYTPEVLTRFVVEQALAELTGPEAADPDSIEWSGRQIPRTLSAREILDLTVCEPALGSGAFAIEAVRQLADQYLARRQHELGERIDPDAYPRELQKVKAYLALHQVYGVDLNATAVELAEISLWLDTMVEGLQAPWFGLHLRRGNSLIGARHAVFTRAQVEKKKAWLTEMPRDVTLADMPADVADGREGSASGNIHHFLVPADGWGSAINAKEAKALAPDALEKLKQWRKTVLVQPTKSQVDTLVGLGRRVEALWQLTWRRLTIAESEVRRSINVWGADDLATGGAVTREQIENTLKDPNGAYRRLRRVMDAWCAMWFWPLTEKTAPPTLAEWITTLQKLLGQVGRAGKVSPDQLSLGTAASWDELDDAERNDLAFALAADVDKTIDEHPWLAAAQRVADQQGFFHWELDFAPVFSNGGFDLQVGNPPWVRPRSDVEALLAEADPWWQLKATSTVKEDAEHRAFALSVGGTRELVLDGTADVAASAAFVGAVQQYPHLVGLQPDLYRCFMEQTWRHAGSTGSVGLIHLESHFTDEKAGPLREQTYRRLRRHWQFINEFQLFEIQHQKRYGVNIYGSTREPSFMQAASLYHPDTVIRSFSHDGSGDEPGIKDPNGNWDVRPHRGRLVHVDMETLRTWHAVLEEDETPVMHSRMVYAVNRATAAVLDKLSAAPRMGRLDLQFSRGWDESIDRKKGFFDSEWGVPESWDDVILQGPHLFVGTPFYKIPNPSMLNHLDWSSVDLEALDPGTVPATSYKPRGDRKKYDLSYTHWPIGTTEHQGSANAEPSGSAVRKSAAAFYRVAWRRMAANTGERTLIPAIIPPGAAHTHLIYSTTVTDDPRSAGLIQAFAGSLLADFVIRSVQKNDIIYPTFRLLPYVDDIALRRALMLRVLRLNCLTSAYADLWATCFRREFQDEGWAGGIAYSGRPALGGIGRTWTSETPLRRASDRRQALVELDVLVALALGITADELCTIYRTQFPVLHGYDGDRDHFDANGRLVPTSVVASWRRKGRAVEPHELVAAHPGSGHLYAYELPFVRLNREEDFRHAFTVFGR